MAMIIGSMYAGIASPTEAAAVGVLGSLIVAALQSSLTWPNLREAFMAALRTNSMIGLRSEEHTSELQSLMRISYAVFCLQKKKPLNPPRIRAYLLPTAPTHK